MMRAQAVRTLSEDTPMKTNKQTTLPVSCMMILCLLMPGLARSGPQAYISNYLDNTVSVIDVATDTVIDNFRFRSLPDGDLGPWGVAVRPGGQEVYFSQPHFRPFAGGDAVAAIGTSAGHPKRDVAVGRGALGIAVDPLGRKLYQVNADDGSITVIRVGDKSTTTLEPGLNYPFGIAAALVEGGVRLYVTENGSDTVAVVDPAQGTVLSRISVGRSPTGIAVNPSGTRVYVANYLDQTLSVINAATADVICTTAVGYNPFGVAVNPSGARVYVANQTKSTGGLATRGTVSVINARTNTEISRLRVGRSPSGIAVTPDGSKIYVANTGGNTVSVIAAKPPKPKVVKSVKVGAGPVAFGAFIGSFGVDGGTVDNWMSRVHPDALIYMLDLPGSHDAATYKSSWGSYYQTQTKNISNQLEWGVRVLDIRLKMSEQADARGFRNLLTAHGSHTYDSFGVILNQCIAFLNQHPSETIVMMISDEGSAKTTTFPTFNDSVIWYLKEADTHWEERFPNTSEGRLWGFTMHAAKGKVLLVRRDKPVNEPGWIGRAQEIQWSSEYKTDGVKVRIQDEWGEKFEPFWKFVKTKREAIEKIKVRKTLLDSPLIIQHLSASFKQTPFFVANHMFQMFIRDMNQYRQSFRLGWFMMDYVGWFWQSQIIRDQIISESTNLPRAVSHTIPENIIVDNPNPAPDTRHTNFKLDNGHAIVSSGNIPRYALIMQPDNNLVLYHFIDWYNDHSYGPKKWGSRGIAIWSSGTAGKGSKGSAYADLQSDLDGNFVIYLGQGRKNAIWDTHVYGDHVKGDGISLQDDGNLVIYRPDGKVAWAAFWILE